MKNDYIVRTFPEIKLIKDGKLAQGVMKAWLISMQKGNWKKLDSIPFTLLVQTRKTLVEHTRAVTGMAMAIARLRSDLNWDFVVAGGLVHDVGKLLEYEYKHDKYVKSEYGKRIRHPVSGYYLALEAGLPLEVAHIVAAHSEEGEKVCRSPEAVLIHHCDFIDFDIEKAKLGK